MAQIPQHIIVPRWQELPSGLLVPSSLVDRIEADRGREDARLPADLRGTPAPVAVVDALPVSADQWAGALNEEELGLDASTLEELVELITQLPFEHAFLLAARLAAALWHVREDAAAQVALVRELGMPGLADATAELIADHERGRRRLVVFAEQYVTALQRLLVEHARAEALDHQPSELELRGVVRAYFAAASVVSSADADLRDGEPGPERWLVYSLKNGLYNARPPMVNTFTRARELFAVLAPQLADHEDYCPLDEWFLDDYELTAAEQHTAGFATYVLSGALEENASPGERSLMAAPIWRGDLADKAAEVESALAATRDWYREEFGAGADLDAIAWERRPFLRRPFIRLADGQWLLVGPRMIESWLGEGFLHRALESAQSRNQSLRFSRFFGALVERYCLDLAQSVYPGERPAGGGRVFGEQPYGRGGGQRTSDIAIDLGTDIVLIEVVSARLTVQMQVFGNRELLEANLERMLFKKMRQLGRVTSDVLSGTAPIPDVDVRHVTRLWPVIVTAGELMQTEMLWDQIDERMPDGLREARFEPLTVLDIEDFELLLGLVAEGRSLTTILRGKNAGPYRRLEISRFATDELHLETPLTQRPSIMNQRWDALAGEMHEVLQFEHDE